MVLPFAAVLSDGRLRRFNRKFSDAGVDLIYIDPPFGSSRDYEILMGRRA